MPYKQTFLLFLGCLVAIGIGGSIVVARQLVTEKQKLDNRVSVLETELGLLKQTTTEIAAANATLRSSAGASLSSTTDVTKRIEALEKKLATVSKQPIQATPKPGSEVKEITLFLGTGATTNREWTTMTGAVGSLNTTHYGKIKAVYFEAGLSIIGGEAHARLVNKTTGQPFFTSEVFHNAGTAAWKQSPVLQLPSGEVEYTVELRSSSGERAILEGSRIRVIVE